MTKFKQNIKNIILIVTIIFIILPILYEFYKLFSHKEGYENYVFYVDDWNERSLNKVQRLPGIQSISVHMFNEMIGAARKNIQL